MPNINVQFKKNVKTHKYSIFPITHANNVLVGDSESSITLSDTLKLIEEGEGGFGVDKEKIINALGYTPYTPAEVDNLLSALETNIDWKEAVETFNDINIIYPNPEDGWTVNVKDTDYTYRYNGTEWVAISANAIPKATDTVDGILSKNDHAKYEDASLKKHEHPNKTILDDITANYTAEEKTKLSGISDNANNYTHPTESGYNHIPSGGKSGQILKWSADGTAIWEDENVITNDDLKHTHDISSPTNNGFMSSTDKVKLDGIQEGAQVNQNSISNIIVGSATIASSRATDSLTLIGNNVTLTGDAASKSVKIGITRTNVTDVLGYIPYTRNEIDNLFSTLETNIDWKEAVASYEDIATTYPNPEDGWTVNVKDTDYTYRYNGTEWVAISANAIPKVTDDVDGILSKEDYVKIKALDDKIGTTNISSISNTITGAIVALSNADVKEHNHTLLTDVTSIKFAISNNMYDDADICVETDDIFSSHILKVPSLYPSSNNAYLGTTNTPWFTITANVLSLRSTNGKTGVLFGSDSYTDENSESIERFVTSGTISPSATIYTLGNLSSPWSNMYASKLTFPTGTSGYVGTISARLDSGTAIPRMITNSAIIPEGRAQSLGISGSSWNAVYCNRMYNSDETLSIFFSSSGISITGDIYPYVTGQSNGKLSSPWTFGYLTNLYFVPNGQTEKYATMYGLINNSVVDIYTDSAIIPTSANSTTTTLGSSSKAWYATYTKYMYIAVDNDTNNNAYIYAQKDTSGLVNRKLMFSDPICPGNSSNSTIGLSNNPWYTVYTGRIYSSGESYGFLFSSGVMVKGSFYPYTSNTYTLGTSSYLFSGIYGLNIYTKAFETELSTPAIVPPSTLNSSSKSSAQVGTQHDPFNKFYATTAYHFTDGTWWNGISFSTNMTARYGTDTNSVMSSGRGLTIGESGLQLTVSTSVASFTCANGVYSSNGYKSGSDEKIKIITDDISNDTNSLVKLFDILKLRSFKYRYRPNNIIIGVNAEELEKDMKSVGLEPSKYEILMIEYDKYLSRGDSPEDDKFYNKFISVSYERLATLAIVKIQDMEKTHVDRLNSLEQRLLELEQKG